MITRKDLSDFAKFCDVKYQIKLNQAIIEDFFQDLNKTSVFKKNTGGLKEVNHSPGCNSNNIECTHLNFDSAKCSECPY